MWGLMCGVGKGGMEGGIRGVRVGNMGMIGGGVCFWSRCLFVKEEKVNGEDLVMVLFGCLLGIVWNEGCFSFGL